MINRRSVLAATLIVPVAAHAIDFDQAPGAASDRQSIRPRYFVLDRPLAPADDLSARCAESGVTVLRTGDDLTALYLRLDRELAAAPFAVAGATTGNAFFVLERLGWDRGLRTAYRGAELDQAPPVHAQQPPSAAGRQPLVWLLVPR